MNSDPAPRIAKLPFLIGDLLLLASAGAVVFTGVPLDGWRAAALVAAVALGGWLGVWPFVLQFRAATRSVETAQLTAATAQVANLEAVARQISSATAELQHVHQSATQAVTAADHIAERMTVEARNFGELLTKLNDSERNHLRLEVDKLRRGEGEWLQIIVRILDHVYALHLAGVRSGQQNLIDQLSAFQNACRDTARRVGLVPLVPQPGAVYDENQHQLFDGQEKSVDGVISDVMAPGYTFQGQLVRRALVSTSLPGDPQKDPAIDPQLSFEDQH